MVATYYVSLSFINFYENRTSTSNEVVRNSNESHICLAFAMGLPGRRPEPEIPQSFSMEGHHSGRYLEDLVGTENKLNEIMKRWQSLFPYFLKQMTGPIVGPTNLKHTGFFLHLV